MTPLLLAVGGAEPVPVPIGWLLGFAGTALAGLIAALGAFYRGGKIVESIEQMRAAITDTRTESDRDIARVEAKVSANRDHCDAGHKGLRADFEEHCQDAAEKFGRLS